MTTKGRSVRSVESERRSWAHCKKCLLWTLAFRHVWGEGPLPCDVLVIGEAPGASEDAIGKPFVGPSGQLLRKALPPTSECRVFLTNLVACIPTADYLDRPSGVRPPRKSEVLSCSPRLQWICAHSKAKRVLLLGKEPAQYWPTIKIWTPRAEVVQLPHPAYALRKGALAQREWVEGLKRWFRAY